MSTIYDYLKGEKERFSLFFSIFKLFPIAYCKNYIYFELHFFSLPCLPFKYQLMKIEKKFFTMSNVLNVNKCFNGLPFFNV